MATFVLVHGAWHGGWYWSRVARPLRAADQRPEADLALPVEDGCSKPATGAFDRFAAPVEGDRGWRFHDLKMGHDAMVTAPAAMVKILAQR